MSFFSCLSFISFKVSIGLLVVKKKKNETASLVFRVNYMVCVNIDVDFVEIRVYLVVKFQVIWVEIIYTIEVMYYVSMFRPFSFNL